MDKFKLIHSLTNPLVPDSNTIRDIILENNDEFKIYKDIGDHYITIVCKNKPRNSVIWGIQFIKI